LNFGVMSALGHKRTFRSAIAMSTLPSKADIRCHARIVLVPITLNSSGNPYHL
jgi:hypothetical protein